MADTKALPSHAPAFPGRYGDGMTLRDYFATQALIGIAMTRYSSSSGLTDFDTYDEMAEEAYRYADAMLATREKNHG